MIYFTHTIKNNRTLAKMRYHQNVDVAYPLYLTGRFFWWGHKLRIPAKMFDEIIHLDYYSKTRFSIRYADWNHLSIKKNIDKWLTVNSIVKLSLRRSQLKAMLLRPATKHAVLIHFFKMCIVQFKLTIQFQNCN